jgi:hypothetical protein
MKFLKVDKDTYINIDKIILIERYKPNHTPENEYLGDYTMIHFEANQHSKYAHVIMKFDIETVLLRGIKNFQY